MTHGADKTGNSSPVMKTVHLLSAHLHPASFIHTHNFLISVLCVIKAVLLKQFCCGVFFSTLSHVPVTTSTGGNSCRSIMEPLVFEGLLKNRLGRRAINLSFVSGCERGACVGCRAPGLSLHLCMWPVGDRTRFSHFLPSLDVLRAVGAELLPL